jgi:hypothetical protein
VQPCGEHFQSGPPDQGEHCGRKGTLTGAQATAAHRRHRAQIASQKRRGSRVHARLSLSPITGFHGLTDGTQQLREPSALLIGQRRRFGQYFLEIVGDLLPSEVPVRVGDRFRVFFAVRYGDLGSGFESGVIRLLSLGLPRRVPVFRQICLLLGLLTLYAVIVAVLASSCFSPTS